MATKLSLYQGACLAMEERKLLNLTEQRESRRNLDTVWDRNVVKTCLQAGLWNFARRTAQLDYSSDVEPPFGYRRAFDKPVDWVRTLAICEDEFFKTPHLRYSDESGFIFSDLDTLYAGWVSDDTSYGGNLGKWPENFTRYVELYLAQQVAPRTTGSKEVRDRIDKELVKTLAQAKSTDAMDEATTFMPPGTWTLNRRGRRTRSDRGNPNRLIG